MLGAFLKRQPKTLAIGAFLISYHLTLILLLPYYLLHHSPSWLLWAGALITLYGGGIGITAGYHRYFSHKSYQTRPIMESLLLFWGSSAIQGSALKWGYDHRIHHAFVDTQRDPYSIKKGFWYAHILWLFHDGEEIDPKVVPDLMHNPRVRFQHRFSVLCMALSNALITLFFGWLTQDFLGAFAIVFLLRLFALHHFTWFINSAAHTWGSKPFSEEQSAVNNFILSFLTFGEGYHNFHHTYANDYRNGIRWYHFDPTKWVIWTLHQLGLASSLRRVSWQAIDRRILAEKKEQLQLRLTELYYIKKEVFEQRITELSLSLEEEMSRLHKLKQEYAQFGKDRFGKEKRQELKREIQLWQKRLRSDWERWRALSHTIMNLELLPEN